MGYICLKKELLSLGLYLKNRKTVVVPATKRQIVTGIVVNAKVNLVSEYKRKVRQEVYYIQRFGINKHLMAGMNFGVFLGCNI